MSATLEGNLELRKGQKGSTWPPSITTHEPCHRRGFPKIRVPILGVLIQGIIILNLGNIGVPLFLGNAQEASSRVSATLPSCRSCSEVGTRPAAGLGAAAGILSGGFRV